MGGSKGVGLVEVGLAGRDVAAFLGMSARTWEAVGWGRLACLKRLRLAEGWAPQTP